MIERKSDGNMVFEIDAVIIQELEREFMGYAEELKVLPPVALACTMRNKFLENANLFQ